MIVAPSSKRPEADSSYINSLAVSWVIGFDMVRGIAIFVERVGLSLLGEIEENVQRVFVDDMTEIGLMHCVSFATFAQTSKTPW